LRRAPRASIGPDKVAQASKRLALLARSALTGRAFLASVGCAWAGLLFGLLLLELMFVAVRCQPGFGPLAVACSAASVVSALPVTTGATAHSRRNATPDELTPQEARIASVVGEGLSNPEIAARQYIR
jgi:hypothetical protein